MSLSLAIETEHAQPPSLAHTHFSSDPLALTEILDPAMTLAVWQREHAGLEQLELIRQEAQSALLDADWRDIRIACNPSDMPSVLNELWGTKYPHLQADISLLSDMFACLLDAEQVAIRLVRLDRAMCPRFHTDKIPCRLVTTYQGAGTEWLEESSIERQYLGRGANGKADSASGLIRPDAVVQQLQPMDVGILKGDAWPGNEGRGIVHRSPSCDPTQPRIVMTLDFAA
ncbi:MAG: DUF1826 domain-containing protein [Firmicutes bacterium]|nr:DUF1826 domain-containing protein [Bacillota bacterium]